PGVAQATLALHAPGLLAFAFGLTSQRPGWTIAGAAIMATGILAFAANLGATLRAAPRRDLTWIALALADLFLVLTVVLGLALALNLRSGFLGADRIVALAVHLHVALVGWVLMVMVGVGHKLLPMFLLSHGADERWGRWAVGLLAGGIGLLFALHHTQGPWVRILPAPLLVAGAGAFLLQARAFYRHRRRPALDPGMRTVAASLGVLGGAVVLGAVLSVTGFARPHLATAYVAALILGISLFVAAHYYKILPFLVWYHRYAPRAGKGSVTTVAQLYSARAAAWAGRLLTAGTVALVGGVALGAPLPVRLGALAVLGGTLVEALQMLTLSRRRPA
ncbi:MAG TPA: hypothetical protein VLA43_02795, partial [Longimicrobiales bacterium]|nr:hypothetical protein [Longimicrobiales bacterium]